MSSSPQFGKYDTLIKYTLVPSIPLSIIAILCINPNTWVLSEIHHFYIELFAVLLAAILSFYYLARAKTLDDKFSLFIGIGFLVNALIDLLHVVISFTYMHEFLFLKYFIPQTWFAGRIFLGAMFAIAITGYYKLSPRISSLSASEINDLTMNSYSNKKDVKIVYEPKDIFIMADKERISQVISNLLSNALKFTSKGSVSVTSVRSYNGENEEAIVSIKDTGQGIDLDILPKLFSKFTSKSFAGTGLGLYICKNIVESHGGKIQATNNSDKKGGATFTFTVPLRFTSHSFNEAVNN